MRNRKPRVTLKCPANMYTGPDERIVEFSANVYSEDQMGGLISFRKLLGQDGVPYLRVEVYRCDERVVVVVPKR